MGVFGDRFGAGLYTLIINRARNSARVTGPSVGASTAVPTTLATPPCEPSPEHVFARRWAADMLGELATQARQGQALSAKVLQQHLQHRGQATPLNRAQLHRLVNALQPFLASHPVLQLQLQHAPRQSSVGPWTLTMARPVVFTLVDEHAPGPPALADPGTAAPAYPQLLTAPHPHPERLRSLLSRLLVSDAFSIDGQQVHALDVLDEVASLPDLTPEAQALVHLRRANLLRRMGRFDEVQGALAASLQRPASTWRDPAIPERARQCLQRMRYDERPGTAWSTQLAAPQAPVALTAPDPLARMDWHNLMALSQRRSMCASADPQQRSHSHRQALQHLEAALYLDLCLRSWDTLQAHISNLAYHMQHAIPLGLSTVQEVHDWHLLSIACTEKLECGRDSVWEVIFFAEFWFDHCADLADLAVPILTATPDHPGGLLLISDQLHPSQAAYHQRALQRIATCGDARQTATAHIMHLRWAQRYQPILRVGLAQTLADYLEAHPLVRDELLREGYAPWVQPRQ
jgi:hypothetical protein